MKTFLCCLLLLLPPLLANATDRTDSFNRADSGSLGTPSDGGSAWTDTSGFVWTISGNTALATGFSAGWDNHSAYLESSVSAVEVQATLVSLTNGLSAGLIGRLTDDNNYIIADVTPGASGTLILLKKTASNTFTQIGLTYTGSVVTGDVIKLRMDSANLLTIYQNGVSRVSGTDSFNSTATKHGLVAHDPVSWDNFSITAITSSSTLGLGKLTKLHSVLLLGIMGIAIPRRKYVVFAALFLAITLVRDASAVEPVCARGDILLCEDFEWSTDPNFVAIAADWRAHGWDWGDSDSAGFVNSTVYCNNTGTHTTGFLASSKCAYQVEIEASPSQGTPFPLHPITNIQVNGSWVYARMYVKFSSSYVFIHTNEQKLAYFRADVAGSAVWRVEMQQKSLDANRNTGRWQINPSPPHDIDYECNIVVPCIFQPNVWYSVEFGVHTPTSASDNDGGLRVWVNGILVISRDNIPITAGNTNPITGFWLSQFYGGADEAHPQQWLWIDNIVVSTSYIGPALTYHPLKFVLLVTTTSSTPVSAGVPVPDYPTLTDCNNAGRLKVAALATPVAMRAGQRYQYQCLPVES